LLSATNRSATEDLFALDSSNIEIDMGLALNLDEKLFLEARYGLIYGIIRE
jgi:hypothetical protein